MVHYDIPLLFFLLSRAQGGLGSFRLETWTSMACSWPSSAPLNSQAHNMQTEIELKLCQDADFRAPALNLKSIVINIKLVVSKANKLTPRILWSSQYSSAHNMIIFS